jgi:hypothetical protein
MRYEPIFLSLTVLALVLLAFVFWVWTLLHAINNPSLSGTEKIVWLLVIFFLNFPGALIYSFAGRRT